MKYWGRVQGNRWLVAKMFGVLMICEFVSLPSWYAFPGKEVLTIFAVFLLWVLIAG
jgi:hypothetical protein